MNTHVAQESNFRNVTGAAEAIIDEMLSRSYVRFSSTDAWQPKVNLYETADSFHVCVDLAGMKPDDIQVNLESDAVTIRGNRPQPLPRGVGEVCVQLMEIDAGAFCRRVEVPRIVRREGITADYRDGYLWITIPKAN